MKEQGAVGALGKGRPQVKGPKNISGVPSELRLEEYAEVKGSRLGRDGER